MRARNLGILGERLVMRGRVALLVAAIVAFVSGVGCGVEQPAPPRSITAAVNAELARIEAVHAAIDPAALPEFARGALEQNVALLDRVRTAASPQLRLYRLRDASASVGAIAYLARHRGETTTHEALLALWTAEGKGITLESPRRGGTLVERAFAQSARNRAMKLYKASLPYGKADAVDSGTYYLGEVSAGTGYAKFVESLPIDPTTNELAPPAGAIDAAIAALEGELAVVFERDRTSRDAIYPSSLLKEAREQRAAGLLDAAAMTLMEARLAVSRAAKNDPPADAAIPEIPPTASDASLTSLFAAVARQRGPEFQRVIVRDVLPFHATLYAPVAVVDGKDAPVTVTLVRWPYT